ncbi:hypothetical protein Tco_0628842 [Tanacetum coccineum]|uniref:Uncharacterized protein n=1 Tax=Tanacetum coccineum TaxID=301880 RepID=A0ABQ4WRF3_9ASTR
MSHLCLNLLVPPTEDESEASERGLGYEGVLHQVRLARKKSLKKQWMQKESVSKQGRKPAKSEPTVHKDLAFDDLDDIVDDAMDYIETEDAQDEGRTSYVVLEEKESAEKGVSTEDQLKLVLAKPKSRIVSTDKLRKGMWSQKYGTSDVSTALNVFKDDETIAEFFCRIEAEWTLAARLEEEERETFTLRHVGGKKHADLKNKNFEEIQVLYKKVKRSDKDFQNFVAIRSAEDERQIKELNKDPKKKRVVNETPREEDTTEVPAEQEVTKQGTKKRKSGHVKMIARKMPRPQPDDDSDDEHIKCLRIVTFESTIDSEIMETKSFIAKLHKVLSPDGNYLVIYRVNGHFIVFNYLMKVLYIFDRHDLFHLYDLVMKQYSKITPKDIELILWGDLKIMMESSTEESDQELKDGTVIYMLVERRYPLSKELLQQMIDLGLEVEEESTAALQLGSQLTLASQLELASPGEVKQFWLSIHLVVYNEELAIPEQTATGKGNIKSVNGW